jgi:hypothetical protein
MIFRDEGVKKLFLDLKTFVMEPLQVAHSVSKEALQNTLDMYLEWSEALAIEELERMKLGKIDAVERLTGVCVLYAKYIYARNTVDGSVSIKRPRMENMLKGMFTRLARTPSVRSGVFFELDPMRQDFLIRDIFRLSLGNDCITVIIEPESEIQVKEEEEPKLEQFKEERTDAELGRFEEDNRTIGPDDSISRVMTRMEEREEALAAAASISAKENPTPDVKELKLESPALPAASFEHSVVQSATSAMTSRTKGSEFKRPKNVRRVIIEENEEEAL